MASLLGSLSPRNRSSLISYHSMAYQLKRLLVAIFLGMVQLECIVIRLRKCSETASKSVSLTGVPARLVWGAADQFQKIGYGYRLAYELGAPLDRIEEGKHFVPEDYPEEVAAAVNELLEQTAPDR
jgi:pimeloyl-ACP methyl ester carboxylesterase